MLEQRIMIAAAMAVCLILSAFLSATETAFLTLSRAKLKSMAEKGKKNANLALKFSEEKEDKLFSTALIGNTVSNMVLAALGTVLFADIFSDSRGAAIALAVVTVAALIFGEITPKSVANDRPEKVAVFAAPGIRVFMWVLTPVTWCVSLWRRLLSKRAKPEEEDKSVAQEELLQMVEDAEAEGNIDTEEVSLLKNAIEFSEQKAEDILTHRTDMEAVSSDTDKGEIARVFSKSGFSRLPVFGESIDDIIGILHRKDLYVNGGITDAAIEEIVTPPLFVHQSEKLSDLLKLLQRNKSHMAIVLDEYGGTLGLVTMEDILEELVGEIWDEHDEVTVDFKPAGDGYAVDCTVNMDDFAEFFGVEIESESVSLGGWITEMLEKIPAPGDSFVFGPLTVTVTELDSHRVAFAEVKKSEEEAETAEEAKPREEKKTKQ